MTNISLRASLAMLQALAADVAQRSNLRLLAIKGDSLGHHGLRDSRVHADVDVLVAPTDIDSFLAGMSAVGWYPRMGRFNDYPVPNHSVTLIHDHWSVDLDVHRLFPGFLRDPVVVFDELWARREPMESAHRPVNIPDLPSSILIMALHSVRSKADNSRHAHELRHLVTLSADWSASLRTEVTELAAATGCSQALGPVLPLLGLRVEPDDSASPADLARWLRAIDGKNSSLNAWRANLTAQPVHRWPGLLLNAVWPSEEYLRAISRMPPGGSSVNRVRIARLRRGWKRIKRATAARLGLRKSVTPVSELAGSAAPRRRSYATSLVSVIIPVFNTAPFLRECLASVLAQTHSDLEVLCIDDGSTDGSAELLHQIADEDPRVRVIREEHRGVGAARNTGLTAATGEFITFVDSDDVIDETLVAILLDALGESDAAMCGWRGRARRISGREAVEIGLRQGHLNTTSKLLRADLLRRQGLTFDAEQPIREDIIFNVAHLLPAEEITVLPEDLYSHRPRPRSLTTACRPHKCRELMAADAQISKLTRELHTPRFVSLLTSLHIRSLVSAGLNLHHPDSTLTPAEAARTMRRWQAEQGPLRVRHGSATMRLTGLAYRCLGLVRTVALAQRVKVLRARFRGRRR